MKAWFVDLAGIRSLVAAERKTKAIAATLASAQEAGWRVTWTDARACRAYDWDAWAQATKIRHPTTEEFARYEDPSHAAR